MFQTSFWLVLFIVGFACLPWLIKWLQRRTGLGAPAAGASRILSTLALSPQQRVVTVEIVQDGVRTRLVLGVSPQSVNCLHVLPLPQEDATLEAADFAMDGPYAEAVPAAGFAQTQAPSEVRERRP